MDDGPGSDQIRDIVSSHSIDLSVRVSDDAGRISPHVRIVVLSHGSTLSISACQKNTRHAKENNSEHRACDAVSWYNLRNQ